MSRIKEEYHEEICESFELLDEDTYEDYIRNKYGYGLLGTFKLAYGESNHDEINVEVI